MEVDSEEYQKHPVFVDLERYATFYELLAGSVFGFITLGSRGVCSIDSYLFSSVQGTLMSIEAVLREGRIGDAYALLRKYYDSAVINIYIGLYLEGHFNIDNLVVEQIDKWVQGKERLPEFRIMSQYIRQSPEVAMINDLLWADGRYKRLRDRCNDHTHYNFFRNVLINDKEVFLEWRRRTLDELSVDLRDVLIMHVSYIFFANEHFMMSSDYRDCLECGMEPEADSQYWVAPFIQELFDQVIKKFRPDLAAIIKQHSAMHLT